MAMFVEIEVTEVLRESEKAYLFDIDGDEMWFPKSHIRTDTFGVGSKNVKVEVSKWIADEKGLEYDNERNY